MVPSSPSHRQGPMRAALAGKTKGNAQQLSHLPDAAAISSKTNSFPFRTWWHRRNQIPPSRSAPSKQDGSFLNCLEQHVMELLLHHSPHNHFLPWIRRASPFPPRQAFHSHAIPPCFHHSKGHSSASDSLRSTTNIPVLSFQASWEGQATLPARAG